MRIGYTIHRVGRSLLPVSRPPRGKHAPRVAGFTLVEMLVVIAIIGVLMGLLFPAISAVNENARRTRCASNLKQIATAAAGYLSTNRAYPPGYLGPKPLGPAVDPFSFQFVGVHAYLLPFMGQDNLSDSLGVNLNINEVGPSWWSINTANRTARKRISELLCPSAPIALPTNGAIANLNTYLDTSGNPTIGAKTLLTGTEGGELFATTNYLGCAGAWGRVNSPDWDRYVGILHNRSRLAAVPDGSSYTLMFGEANNMYGRYTYTWMGAGALPAAPRQELLDHTIADAKDWRLFSSTHTSVVQYAFGDGSVKPLSVTIDQGLYLGLAGIADGVAVDLDQFSNE